MGLVDFLGGVLMKVGDLVSHRNHWHVANKRIGTVVGIVQPRDVELSKMKDWQQHWFQRMGRRIDVLWSDGSISTAFNEADLEVLNESR